jgi:2-haloacid dehalogenase/putative hydrolase of the HAD superfamily
MAQLDGIFLDFYGTLAGGDRAAVVNICRQVIVDHGLPTTPDEMAVAWGHRYFAAIETVDHANFRDLTQIETDTLVETVLKLGGKIDATAYIQALNAYLAAPPLFEEVREVVAALKLPVCIVSNADERELSKALLHHGLQFKHVVTSEKARSYKPESRIFSMALKLTGWSPARVLHVGDSLHSDVAGARRMGIRTAWVNRSERISDIGTDEPDVTWQDLRPLASL